MTKEGYEQGRADGYCEGYDDGNLLPYLKNFVDTGEVKK